MLTVVVKWYYMNATRKYIFFFTREVERNRRAITECQSQASFFIQSIEGSFQTFHERSFLGLLQRYVRCPMSVTGKH